MFDHEAKVLHSHSVLFVRIALHVHVMKLIGGPVTDVLKILKMKNARN